MWVKVMESLTRPGGFMGLTLPALEHVVDLEANVIDLRVPLRWHCLWEGPGGKKKRGSTTRLSDDSNAAFPYPHQYQQQSNLDKHHDDNILDT